MAGSYEKLVDRESAFEQLSREDDEHAHPEEDTPARKRDAGGVLQEVLFGSTGPRGGKREGLVEVLAKSAARSMGSSLAREFSRGVLGSLLGGGKRQRRR